jgi:hypothetical protein
MANNPGKKGKPAPWVRREQQDHDQAWAAFEREHAPSEYWPWLEAYRAAEARIEKEAKREIPTFGRGEKAAWEEKHGWGSGDEESYRRWEERKKLERRKMQEWLHANPSPYKSEQKAALYRKFQEVYVPVDRS